MGKYSVQRTPEERTQLLALVRPGRAAAVTLRHARLRLNADVGAGGRRGTDAEIADAVDPRAATGQRVRQACVEQGLAVA
jgi:hypothetical protein